jgi:hypothetical protein
MGVRDMSRDCRATRLRPGLLAATMVLLLCGPALCQAAGTGKWRPPPEKNVPPADYRLLGASPAEPVHTSVLEVLGKVSLAVLLLYAVAFAVSRNKGLRPLARWLPVPAPTPSHRLRICEMLPLARQEGTLYLLEVEGQTLLIAAAGTHCELLWSPAADQTTSFEPVVPNAPAVRPSLPPRQPAPDDVPLYQRGVNKAPRRESEWARERNRLIHALMQPE